MSNDSKYIVITEWDNMDSVPILFPSYLEHADVVRRLGVAGKIESAGFCTISSIEDSPREGEECLGVENISSVAEYSSNGFTVVRHRWICYGRSSSLGVQCNKVRDQRLLDKFFR